ncbi:MAG: DUF3160 domain-containing protein [Actinobacteria bacterium]|nr:DUF3160 domain-containing protein [Actinomycetota bacterium]
MRRARRLLPVLLACVLLAACSGDTAFSTTTAAPSTTTAPSTTAPPATGATTTTTSPPTTTTTGATTTTLPEGEASPLPDALPGRAGFGSFIPIPLLDDGPTVVPGHPTSLGEVYWEFKVTDWSGTNLRSRLESEGFALDGSWPQDTLHPIYTYRARYADGPVYVTTDAGYHMWHLVFSKALRDIEAQALLPRLEELVGGLAQAAREQRAALAGTPAAAAADDVAQHLEAVATLLGLDVGEIGARAAEEVALAELHAAFAVSPTLGVEVDYTLAAPRGHYTRSEDLTRYFRAMALLGSTPFPIADPQALARGVLLSVLLVEDAALLDAWERIYESTSFLVGTADDYTPLELVAAGATWCCSEGGVDPSLLADDGFLTAVADALRAARPVLIDAEAASMRTMGARFTLDAFLLDQLVHPQVWSRLEASVLDVAAAMGSDWALGIQQAAGVAEAYPEYPERLALLRELVAARPAADWGSTVYDAWLYAILPMWLPHGGPFPDYMQSEAWAARAHQGGFGSYTELKHDTVLYTKQAFAEGDEPLPPAPPRHWVEPDPVPFERLAEAAGLLRSGLAGRDLLPAATAELLDRLIAMEARFGRIARDELAGRPISAADNDWLAGIGSEFELIWLLAGEGQPDEMGMGGFAGDPDSKAPVVVDIFSNPWDALEIATGGFDTIYVLVPNDAGHFQVAVGGTYAFYEFWVPRGERLTDEEWREMLMEGEAPDRPGWLATLYD